ncbi:MAG: NAD(P)/FAD-dependent oxidoreductase [Bacteroidota bacterium]
MRDNKYDVIIIGSGMSGLSAASILSQLGNKKVLVLERHFKIGGFTHTFKRKGEHGEYHWDVGLHYVGQMEDGTTARSMCDYVTQGGVKWNKMPDPYDVFIYPDFTFKVREGERNFKYDLIKKFPHEEKNIEKYFVDLKKVSAWSGRYNFSLTLPLSARLISSAISSKGSSLALMTLKEYLDQNFSDVKLKALLASQWGDYGLPPSQSALAVHALIVNHYLNGGFYPVGGSKKIADSIIPIVENNGGALLVNNFVKEIIIEKGKVAGVKVSEKKGNDFVEREYYAEKIISTAGAYITYTEVIPKTNKPRFIDEVKNFEPGAAHVNLYLGLKESPAKLGIKGENYWIYNSYDHDRRFELNDDIIEGKVNGVYVSFPSMKDPEAKNHTAEIITFVKYKPFEKWAPEPWKNRGDEYRKLKEKICDALINFADDHLKGFKKLVDYKELSTPLSTVYFTGNPLGAIYGIPATPERYRKKWIGPFTHIKNLYLSGADAFGHGIVGGLMGGAITAALVMKGFSGIPAVFKEAIKFQHKK